MKRAPIIVVLVVALFGIVGHFDYEDAKQQEALYCSNVKNSVWPDYDGTYDEVCAKDYGAKKPDVKFFR